MSQTLQQLLGGCSAKAQLHSTTVGRVALGKSQAEDKVQPKDGKVMATTLRACTPTKQSAREMGYGHNKQEIKHTVMQVLLFLHADGHIPSLQLSLEIASTHWPQIDMS